MITATSGKLAFNLSFNASMTADRARDTNNRKPRLTMTENDRKRLRRIFHKPLFGLAFNPQMVFIESWISANTAVAPIIKVMIPITRARVPLLFSEAFLMMVWICKAASWPINWSIWSYILPWIASSPKKILHKKMITIRSGPKEKMVVYASDALYLGILSPAKFLKD